MATPTRILYATQNAIVYPDTGVTTTGYALALNSVSLDITNPIENVLVFGTLGAAARLQKEPSKSKISIKSYLTTGVPADSQAFDNAAINTLTGNSLAGKYAKIVVEPNGFTAYGVLTNLALDASTNNFVTLDLSFEGLGTPKMGNVLPSGISNTAYTGTLPLITNITPITSNLVAAGVASKDAIFTGAIGTFINGTGVGACVTSAKFSLDIPMDTVTCLGAPITGYQTEVSQGHIMVGKPPFKATLVVEGTAATACDTVDFGSVLVSLPTPRLVSSTINQAVGNVGQTFNYTVEDITATFSKSNLNGVSEPDLISD